MVWLPDLAGASGPKYRAIRAALARDIAGGRLKAGDRLPPQRDLAEALGVDLSTVTRAYAEAREAGLIAADGRRGSFVRAPEGLAAPSQIAPFDTGMNLPPLPARSSLPELYASGIRAVLAGEAAGNRLQYQPAGGAPQDRQAGAAWLARRGIAAHEDNVLVASGAQTALHAIAHAVLREGEGIGTGPFVYPGWLSLARRLGARLVALEVDEQGITPESLDRAAAAGALKLLYVVPWNDNPTTASMSEARRREIATLARRHDLTIIEDDAYGELAADPPVPLASLAPERVWYVASLSKIISPALRVAYVCAPTVRDSWALTADLHATTVMAPPLNVAVASEWLRGGAWRDLVAEVRGECLARQRILRESLPASSYRTNGEGYHLWLPLPATASPSELLAALAPSGLSAVASDAFAVEAGEGAKGMRISIGGSLRQEQLARALSLLDAALHQNGRPRPLV